MKKIIQFGYSVRVPELVFLVDCRVIPNPYPQYAHDKVAARYAVRQSPEFDKLVNKAMEMLLNKHVLAIGIGCGFGVHRSGAVVDELERKMRRGLVPEFEVENWGKV